MARELASDATSAVIVHSNAANSLRRRTCDLIVLSRRGLTPVTGNQPGRRRDNLSLRSSRPAHHRAPTANVERPGESGPLVLTSGPNYASRPNYGSGLMAISTAI
jgi:hypothetical protein